MHRGMPQPRKVPDKETLVKWLEEGLTRQEIVDRQYELTGERATPAAISMAMSRYGLEPRRNRWDDLLPWRLKGDDVDLKEAKLLRLAGRRKAGLKNPKKDDSWLDSWLLELKEAGRPVVAYYPDLEEPFQYHPRVAEDGDGEWDLIRRPEVQEVLDQKAAG